MSLDLDWSLLDEQLSDRFLETINRALDNSSTKRPSFLGDIRFENLQFGSDPPDVAIRSITDIWPDFVSIDDPPVRRRGARQATPASNATTLVESPTETFAPPLQAELPLRTYTQFDDAAPPNRIHGPPSVVSASVAGSMPATPAAGLGGAGGYYQQWSAALASRGIRAAGLGGATPSLPQAQVTSPVDSVPPSPGYFQLWQHHQQQHPLAGPASGYLANASRQTSFDASSFRGGGGPGPQSSVSQIGVKRDSNSLHPPYGFNGRSAFRGTPAASSRSPSGQISPGEEREVAPPSPSSSSSQLPSLQMRLSLVWPTTTFRLTITTSLLINYPSPAFMSLPLTLSVTGFVMRAGLIVALEGEHQRAHVCLVEEEDDEEDAQQESTAAPVGVTGTGGKNINSPGMNILPQVTFESEVGEHEKHVLKNVGKVEKFITEVIRKGLQDELVYPNYYTIDLPNSKGRSA